MKVFGKMKRLLAILLIGGALLFPVCGWPFDKTPGKLDKFGLAPDRYVDLSESVVSVVTRGTGLGRTFNDDGSKWIAAQGVFGQQGSGVVVRGADGNLYILTNAHVVTPEAIEIFLSNSTSLITPILKVTHQITVVGSWNEPFRIECKIVWISQEDDIAILTPLYSQVLLKPIPYDVVSFLDLPGYAVGDAIVVVTGYRDKDPSKEFWPLGIVPEREWYYEARYGKIISCSPKTFKIEALPWFNPGDVTTDIKIYPGDSGSPVFAFVNGKPILIGLMRAYSLDIDEYTYEVRGFYSYFTRINDVVLRYLTTSGLDK
jgi:S1-C subfamily serine protease